MDSTKQSSPLPGETENSASASPTMPSHSLSYEELHRKSSEVLPVCFEGVKLAISKGLNQHFQVSHTLTLSELASGYRFGATYVGTNQIGPGESFPLLMGEMDLFGNSSALFVHQLPKNIRLKLQSQTQKSELVTGLLALDRTGKLSSMSLKLVNPNIVVDSLYLSANYLRRVTERVDLGAEYIYQRDPKIPGKQISALSYALRYTAPHWTLAGNMSTSGLHMSYHHKQSDNLQFAVDFESNFRSQESVTTFGYQIDIPQTMTLRASLDTNWTVGAVLEKKLSRQLPYTFIISGMYNHTKLVTKLGVGLVIG